MSEKPQHVILIILDGWGVAQPSIGNAITSTDLPNFAKLLEKYPVFNLQASGESVGLPWGEQGNSEVGHLSLGSGRIIYQSLPRITKSITDGTFLENPAFLQAVNHTVLHNSKLHLIGMVSDGGVHSYNEHLYALLELAKMKGLNEAYIHVILDGRDTPKDSGKSYIAKLLKVIKKLKFGKIATISGRFYAMDRNNNWDRVSAAYDAIALGKSEQTASDPLLAIENSYSQGIFDEEMLPTVIINNNSSIAKISDNDAVIFFNFRPDRARQLTKALVLPDFKGFSRTKLDNLFMVTMTEYEKDLPVQVAFPPLMIGNPLAEVLSDNKIKQLHIAETEKYAHVTYFFNGGREEAFPGEDHLLIPSPRVDSYAKKPDMAANEITKKVLDALASQKYEFILINFANADMVGHTGDLEATKKALGILDKCIGQITELSLHQGGVCLITADHGNAEEVIKLKSGKIDKEHSANPVPLFMIGRQWEGQPTVQSLPELYLSTPVGVLADVAPTILKIYDIKKPDQMTGQALI